MFFKRVVSKISCIIWNSIVTIRYSKNCSIHKNAQFIGIPKIYLHPNTKIQIGDRSVLCSRIDETALGVNHPVILRTCKEGAEILIGNDVGISGGVICAADSIKIGDRTLIGANVTIIDTDIHAKKSIGRRYNKNWNDISIKPVVIEENVFIGANSIICKGVRVGQNSIIAAGSVVVKDIPENTIAGGNPAREIGKV